MRGFQFLVVFTSNMFHVFCSSVSFHSACMAYDWVWDKNQIACIGGCDNISAVKYSVNAKEVRILFNAQMDKFF